jgi:hypothetical protein
MVMRGLVPRIDPLRLAPGVLAPDPAGPRVKPAGDVMFGTGRGGLTATPASRSQKKPSFFGL